MLTKAIQKFLHIFNVALVFVAGGVLFGPQISASATDLADAVKPHNKPHEDTNPIAVAAQAGINLPDVPKSDPGNPEPSPTTSSIPIQHHSAHPSIELVDNELATPNATINTPSPTPVYTNSEAASAPTHTSKVILPPAEKHASEQKGKPIASKPIVTSSPSQSKPTHTSEPTSTPAPTHTSTPSPTPTHTSTPKVTKSPTVVLATDIVPLTAAQIRAAKIAVIIKFARAQLGEPYASPGNSYSTWDCSGLTQKEFAAAGFYIGTHSATNQFLSGKSKGYLVPYSQKKPGDQIFYGNSSSMYHTTLYTGKRLINGIYVPYMIEAADWGKPVRERNVWGTPYAYVVRWVR